METSLEVNADEAQRKDPRRDPRNIEVVLLLRLVASVDEAPRRAPKRAQNAEDESK